MEDKNKIGLLALSIALSGITLAVSISILGDLTNHILKYKAMGLFVAFQISAIVLGLMTLSTPLGRASAIISAILLIAVLGDFGPFHVIF